MTFYRKKVWRDWSLYRNVLDLPTIFLDLFDYIFIPINPIFITTRIYFILLRAYKFIYELSNPKANSRIQV